MLPGREFLGRDKMNMDIVWVIFFYQGECGLTSRKKEPEVPGLTTLELEYLVSVRDGLAEQELALKWGVQYHIVKGIATAVRKKLGTKDRAHTVVTAIRLGCIPLYPAQEDQEDQKEQKEE